MTGRSKEAQRSETWPGERIDAAREHGADVSLEERAEREGCRLPSLSRLRAPDGLVAWGEIFRRIFSFPSKVCLFFAETPGKIKKKHFFVFILPFLRFLG